MIYLFVFILGAIVGSFLNVVIYRYNTGNSIIKGSSRCFSCSKKLKWHELIPVISFIIQKGRCKSCGSKISIQYPIVEIISGTLFLLIFNFSAQSGLAFGGQFTSYWLLITGYYFIIFSLLIVIAVYDLRHQIIPNLFVYSFIVLSFFQLKADPPLAKNFIGGLFSLEHFITGLAFFSFFAFFWLVSRGTWMGLGDAKLALGMGWLLGFSKGVVALLLSFWIGAAVSIFLLVLAKKKYNLKSKIAFGPFLVLGIIIAFLFAEDIIKISCFSF